MWSGGRIPLLVAAPLLVLVAVFGYLVGHRRPTARPVQGTHEASNGVVSVDYPSGWRSAGKAPSIPGLSIAQTLVLTPAGDTAQTALVVGQIAGSRSNPLPATFLARLGRPQSAQVVNLLNTQAYRYSYPTVPGSGARVTLYAIPESATTKTVALCYSSPGSTKSAGYMRACEQIAATLTFFSPTDEAQAGEGLKPETGYARKVGAAVERVDQLRATLRFEIRPGADRAAAASAAASLGAGLANVVDSLSVVQPPAAARSAHAALLESLSRASAGYSSLATAIRTGSSSGYATAQAQVNEAEAALGAALENYTLIGYG
jgi:hypothetical protein